MTRVCLVGSPDVDLRYELLSRETSRAALAAYEFHRPFANSIAVDTVSLGAAVSLVNDLNWYVVRFVDLVLVRESSVSDEEWLSRGVATAIRNDDLDPAESGDLLAVYGLEGDELVEPMYVARVDGDRPDYDIRDVDGTVVVRVTEDEFGG